MMNFFKEFKYRLSNFAKENFKNYLIGNNITTFSEILINFIYII